RATTSRLDRPRGWSPDRRLFWRALRGLQLGQPSGGCGTCPGGGVLSLLSIRWIERSGVRRWNCLEPRWLGWRRRLHRRVVAARAPDRRAARCGKAVARERRQPARTSNPSDLARARREPDLWVPRPPRGHPCNDNVI